MGSYRTQGYIIKRQNLGEADKIITLFTPDHGKIRLKAKGLRRFTSRRAGSLELFHQVKVLIVPGRSGIDVLTDVELIHSAYTWRKFLGRVSIAYQLSEVIDKLVPEQVSQPELYEFLNQCFKEIPKLGVDWQTQVKSWLVEIVKMLGYWPHDKDFSGDIYEFLERITEKPLLSSKFLLDNPA